MICRKTSFAKLTRLLSNTSAHKLLAANTSSSSFWTSSKVSHGPLCEDGLPDMSCFFWAHHRGGGNSGSHSGGGSSKMKRTGSVDSLLSQVNSNGAMGGDSADQQDDQQSSYQQNEGTAGYPSGGNTKSSGSGKSRKSSSGHSPVTPKSSTYYLGSMLMSTTATASSSTSSPHHYHAHHDHHSGSFSYASGREHSPFYSGSRGSSVGLKAGRRQMSIDVNSGGLMMTGVGGRAGGGGPVVEIPGLKKSDRKRWEKLSKFNFDQQGNHSQLMMFLRIILSLTTINF